MLDLRQQNKTIKINITRDKLIPDKQIQIELTVVKLTVDKLTQVKLTLDKVNLVFGFIEIKCPI